MSVNIRIGVGGWTFAPWRGPFYPKGLRHAGELAWASRRLGAIEINATYHSLQSPESFARWAAETPEDFMFTVKASRFCTNRRTLGDADGPIARFLSQGLTELGDRLGPILWQFMPTKRFDAQDLERFLDLLPASLDGRPLRHCIEPRHESFADPRFAALCGERGVAICLSDHETYPDVFAPTAAFAYARLMRLREDLETGYDVGEIAAWAARLTTLALSLPAPHEVFVFFIGAGGEGKIRAPAAALALARALDSERSVTDPSANGS
jgi:uncharacterized protein YecE (DUF72 family)